jgi:hypothetical protein
VSSEFSATVAEPVTFYHNGHRSDPSRYATAGRRKPPPIEEREVIAWDMEGMNLSGDGAPQHAVIYGCSAEPDKALVDSNLSTMEMLDYMLDVGARHPHAIHVGFGFRYDSNMLVKTLPQKMILRLWRRGHCRFHTGPHTYNISWIPGKRFAVSRWETEHKSRSKVSVNVHDYSSFFGQTFLTVAENILRDALSPEDRETIAHGKTQRGTNTWKDLDAVRHYWGREIQLIRRVFERFRDVMVRAGFPLKDWYGPGALANFINASRGIHPHLGSVQVTSGIMPPEVHAASKIAFSGGRFELFNAGRHEGPIYSVDINSAYPAALTMIPSLHPDAGEWRHVESPDRIKRFGFYRITYHATNARVFEARPMPLFWRDPRGLITYPNRVTGWYASPEARMILGMPGVVIHEGWYWDSREDVFPWEFLHEMYERRMRLGKQNLLSMPFKLGPNSLYGKYAQTVGWNRKEKLPPRSHALPVAAWVTSYCRSQLWKVIRQIPEHVIGVETDSVFATVDPSTLNIPLGTGLGEWSASHYDEMLYLQSGMYHTREGEYWNGTRSRGLRRSELDAETSAQYLRSLIPGKRWEPLRILTQPRFIGAGLALASAEPFRDIHCAWREQERLITLGEAGKRRHARPACQACQRGSTPYDEPHRLHVVSKSDGEIESHPRRLPWESEHPSEVMEIRRGLEMERELISR